MRRIFLLVAGVVLTGVVVWLGFRATENPTYVLWFGLASALIAPLALNLLSNAISRSEKEMLSQLARVPQISELVAQAESQEERIRILQEERDRLDELVRYEAERRALEARRHLLEQDAVRILGDMEIIDRELDRLGVQVDRSVVGEELQRLQDRIEATRGGDVVLRFGKRDVIIRQDLLSFFPTGLGLLGGSFLYQLLRLVESTQRSLSRRRSQNSS